MSSLFTGILVLASLVYAGFALRIVLGLNKHSRTLRQTETPSVAVVVAARNEEQTLPQLLMDLLLQDYAGSFDVYVADDRSTDNTGQILDRFAGKHSNYHAIHIGKTSWHMTPKKHAITECIKRSTADIILATDADCRVGPSWIRSAIEHFDDETGILVGYAEISAESIFERYQALDYIGVVVANAGMMAHGYNWSGSGGNLAYRRSAFTRIGGFNSVAEKISGDDFFLVQTIPKKTGLKAKFNYDPQHFVKTEAAPNLPAFLNQRIRWSSNSKGLEKTDTLVFSFLVSAFLSNFLILFNGLLGWWNLFFLLSIWLKFLAEGMVMFAGARRFGYWHLFWIYPLWFVLQPIYISYVGLMGLRGKFSWKN
jgi:cellulose synthase/poly-beta-1,6-N-acetylglucosamine synthase-like glycosyltransferase